MTASKVSRKVPKKPEIDLIVTPSGAAELPAPAPATQKPARKRTPAVAKVAVVEKGTVAAAVPEANPAKVKKDKLVRDSFTMPESEYAAIAAIKERCLNSRVAAKKSEILRAALAGLAGLNDAEVVAAIQNLAAIKTGRPAK